MITDTADRIDSLQNEIDRLEKLCKKYPDDYNLFADLMMAVDELRIALADDEAEQMGWR